MDAESYRLTLEVIADSIKILGPAIITAIVGYKAGQFQLKQRVEELKRNNEFNARDKIFEFHKEKLAKVDESISNLSEGLGRFSGMALAEREDDLMFTTFVARYLTSYIKVLPFQLNHINDELIKYADEMPREVELISKYLEEAPRIESPSDPEAVQSTIVKLLEIYGSCSHCLRSLIEKEALDIFEPYTSNA